MDIVLFITYSLVLYFYHQWPTKICCLNSSFSDLAIRLVGFVMVLMAAIRKEWFFVFFENKVFSFLLSSIVVVFVFLFIFMGNKICVRKLAYINFYDVVTFLALLLVSILCFSHYSGLGIYGFSDGVLVVVNILFVLWMLGIYFLVSNDKGNNSGNKSE